MSDSYRVMCWAGVNGYLPTYPFPYLLVIFVGGDAA